MKGAGSKKENVNSLKRIIDMNEELLLREQFSTIIGEKKAKLTLLFGLYDLANEMRQEYDDKFEQVKKRIISENEFTFKEGNHRGQEFKNEDRITDPFWDFMMSEEDYESYRKLCTDEYLKLGLIDERGYFTSNVAELASNARKLLTDFIINECIPEPLREAFSYTKRNIVQGNKVIDLFRKIIK